MATATLRALVVDDDPIAQKVVAHALQREGFQSDVASNGIEALKQIASAKYDLVITDLRMPRMHGHALSIELLNRKTTALLVIHSSISDPRLRADLLHRGVDDIIPKPTDYPVFAAKMKVLAEQRRKSARDATGSAKSEAKVLHANAATLPSTSNEQSKQLTTPPLVSSVDVQHSTAALNEMTCLITRTKVFELVDKCSELKPMSPTLSKLLQMLGNDRCSMQEVAKTTKQDQALCLKMLKLANSCVYSKGDRVDSVEKAVLRIGVSQIRQAIMNIGIVEQFSANVTVAGLDMRQFWEHSMAVGLIATELTRDTGGTSADIEIAFTRGLLHDIGRAILAELLGDIYQAALTESQKLGLPLEQVEARLLQVTHADAANRVLTNWRFAKELIQPLQKHHSTLADLRKRSPTEAKEVAILILADRLAHAMLLGKSGNDFLLPTVELGEFLTLPADSFGKIEKLIPDRLQELRIVMLSSSSATEWPSTRDEYRKKISKPIRPIFVCAKPEYDVVDLLLSQLTGRNVGEDEAPNLSVIHVDDPSQVSTLTTKLMAMETELKTGPLHTLVLSPDGRFNLDASAIAGRHTVQFPSTTPLTTLIDALMQLTTLQIRHQPSVATVLDISSIASS